MSDYKPGDRVRVTTEFTLTAEDCDKLGFWTGDTAIAVPVRTENVEVIKRADGPANDPVYTVRRSTDGKTLFVKTAPNSWYEVTPPGRIPFDSPIWDEHMTGTEIVGTVPGTPAADAVKPKLRVFKDRAGEPWFEIRPDSFSCGSTRAEAHEYDRNGAIYTGYSFSTLADTFGPLTQITE